MNHDPASTRRDFLASTAAGVTVLAAAPGATRRSLRHRRGDPHAHRTGVPVRRHAQAAAVRSRPARRAVRAPGAFGAGLGGGSGWVVLGANLHTRRLANHWLADHAHGPAATVPVLVMDMHEHAYPMDHGAAAAKSIDAFFRNIDWERVAARLAAVAAISA